MQTITAETQAEIEDSSQTVLPRITAYWLDSHNVESLRAFSTSDHYYRKTLEMDPSWFYQLNDPIYYNKVLSAHPRAALWMLNDTTSTAVDSGMFGNDGTYTGGYTQSQGSIITDFSTSFNGSSGYVEIPHDLKYTLGYWYGVASVEAWINPDTLGANQTVIGKGDVDATRTIDSGYEWKLYVTSSGQLKFIIYNLDGTEMLAVTGPGIAVDKWIHVVVTWDGNLLKMYANGTFVAIARLDGFLINKPLPNTSPVNIGRMPDGTQYFDGLINGVAFYNTLLSPAEIALHYNIGVGRTYDFSGNGHVGQYVTDAGQDYITKTLMTDDESNRLVRDTRYVATFDGDIYVVLNNQAGTSDLTLECWFKGGSGTIAGKGVDNRIQYALKIVGGNTVQAFVENDAGTDFTVTSGTGDFSTTYHHAVLTVQSNVLKLYVDGVLEGSTTITGSRITTATSFCVGRLGAASSGDLYTGEVFNVATYPTCVFLDEEEVSARYFSVIRHSNWLDYSFNPPFHTADELCNGKFGYGHLWQVLGGKTRGGRDLSPNGKYDVAEESFLDKTYKYEYGWWSSNPSQPTTGEFENPESIILTFDELNCDSIGVFVPEEYSNISTYNLFYKDNTNAWIQIGGDWTLEADTNQFIHSLGDFTDIRGIKMDILSTIIPQDYAKVVEISPLVIEILDADDVVNLNVSKVKENFDSSVPFGATATNSCDFTLENVQLRYNPNNTTSDLYGLMTPDVRFDVALGWIGGGGATGLLLNGVAGNATSPKVAAFIPDDDIASEAYIEPTDWTPAEMMTIVGVNEEGAEAGDPTWAEITSPLALVDAAWPKVAKLGSIYLVGGGGDASDAEGNFWEFDPTDDSFTAIADSPSQGYGVAVSNGTNVYVWGDENGTASYWNGSSWTTLGTSPPGWSYYTGTYHAANGNIYLNAGFDKNLVRYVTGTDTYTTIETLVAAGTQQGPISLVSYGSYIYCLVSVIESTVRKIKVVRYDVGADTQTALTTLTGDSIEWGAATILVDDEIWLIGGERDNGSNYTSDDITVYNITSDTWSTHPTISLPENLSEINATEYFGDDRIYVFGGWKDTFYDPFTYKYGSFPIVATDAGWKFSLLADGKLRFSYSLDGITLTDIDSTASVPFTNGPGYVRFTATNITSDCEIRFYTSTDGTSWTLLGTMVLTGESLVIFDADMPMEIGSTTSNGDLVFPFGGIIYSVIVTDNGSTIIANPDFAADPAHSEATSFVDEASNPWTINSPAELIGGGVEYIPQGTYYSDTFTPDTSGMTTSVACRDRSKYLQENEREVGLIYEDCTGAEAVAGLAKEGGILNSQINIDLPYSQTIIEDGAVAYWNFTERDFQYRFYFDGATYVHSPRPLYFSRPSKYDTSVARPFWIEFWMYMSNSDDGIVFNIGTPSFPVEFGMRMVNGDIVYTIHGSDATSLNTNLPDDTWRHIAIKVETGSIRTYINGVQFNQITPTTYDIGGQAAVLTLGNKITTYPNGFSGANYSSSNGFKGFIADFRIAIDLEEDILSKFLVDPLKDGPTSFYGKEYSTIALFKMNEGSGSVVRSSTDPFNALEVVGGTAAWTKVGVNVVKDKAGINNGTLEGFPSFSNDGPLTSESTSSYEFSGFPVSLLPRPEVLQTNPLTIEAWIKRETSQGGSIFGSTSDLEVTSGGVLTYSGATSVGTVPANIWTHVAVTIGDNETDQDVTFYINGELDTVDTATVSANTIGLTIGTSFGGKISNVAVFNETLSAEKIAHHYKVSLIDKVRRFTALWTEQEPLWEGMLKIALADLGMFFLDENDNFIYETAWGYYNDQYPQHTEVQWTLDEDANIINGSQTIELLVNKVIVKVYPVQSISNSTEQIWSANSSESLAATTLSAALDSDQQGEDSFLSYTSEINEAGLLEPVFPEAGFVRIGDEIIEYTSSDDYKLYGLTRGKFGTATGSYGGGEFVGEAREYNLEWSNTPVLKVKYPFLTAVIFDGTVDVNLWTSNTTKGHLVISLNATFDSENTYQVLQGNNPVSGLDNAFVVAGIPANQEDSGSSQTEVASDFAQKIRRHGVKDITIDNPYIQDQGYAKLIADFVLTHNSAPVKVIGINTIGLPHLQLGDRIDIGQFTMLSVDGIEYWIMGIEISYDGGVLTTLNLKQVD